MIDWSAWFIYTFGVLENRISEQNEGFELTFWCNMRFWNWIFPDFEALECKFSKKNMTSGKCRVFRNWTILKWGLTEQSGAHEKGVLRVAHTYIPFSGEYPFGHYDRLKCMVYLYSIGLKRYYTPNQKFACFVLCL